MKYYYIIFNIFISNIKIYKYNLIRYLNIKIKDYY